MRLENLNISFKYITVYQISIKDKESGKGYQLLLEPEAYPVELVKTIYGHDLNDHRNKFDRKYEEVEIKLNSTLDINDLEKIHDMKKMVRAIYEDTINDISNSNIDSDYSAGRLLRLYSNENNKENACYSPDMCGTMFEIWVPDSFQQHIKKLPSILNKVDGGFIHYKMTEPDGTKAGIIIYSKNKIAREEDIVKVNTFLKGYMKLYENNINVKKMTLFKKNDLTLHDFNLTGVDSRVFKMEDRYSIVYFKLEDDDKEVDKYIEFSKLDKDMAKIVINLTVFMKNNVIDDFGTGNAVRLNSVLNHDLSKIPSKYSYIKDVLQKSIPYFEEIDVLANVFPKQYFDTDNKKMNNEEREHFEWFEPVLKHFYSNVARIDHYYKNMLFYGPYLDKITKDFEFDIKFLLRFSNDIAPELAHVFFKFNIVPEVTRNCGNLLGVNDFYRITQELIKTKNFKIFNPRVSVGSFDCDRGEI